MGEEVQFIRQELIKMDSNAVVELKNKARQNDSGKHRYCFHENENAEMQEMLFVLPHEWYTRPHKHEHAAESQVVIEGEGYFILFDEWGNVSETFKISPQNNFIYRIQKGLWHMVLPISEQMVIYEIRAGKFHTTTVFAEWAPKENDQAGIKRYMEELIEILGGME